MVPSPAFMVYRPEETIISSRYTIGSKYNPVSQRYVFCCPEELVVPSVNAIFAAVITAVFLAYRLT